MARLGFPNEKGSTTSKFHQIFFKRAQERVGLIYSVMRRAGKIPQAAGCWSRQTPAPPQQEPRARGGGERHLPESLVDRSVPAEEGTRSE